MKITKDIRVAPQLVHRIQGIEGYDRQTNQPQCRLVASRLRCRLETVSQATQEQMREVGTGLWMGGAVRLCQKEGKSEGIWGADGKW